jgi:hypothetical protein
MVTTDTSAVKPRLPAHRAKLRDRPTPAVNIRLHVDTYDALRRMKRPGESFDQLIRLLMGRAAPIQEAPSDN